MCDGIVDHLERFDQVVGVATLLDQTTQLTGRVGDYASGPQLSGDLLGDGSGP